MPANLVKSVQDKCDMSKEEAEKKWNKAKQKAADEGHSEEYDYITQIFKHLTGQSCMKKMGWTTNESKIKHLINKYL